MKYIFYSSNAFIDQLVLTFNSDQAAIDFGADYEAHIWKIDNSGNYSLIWPENV